jgi:hypothetical protein
MRGELQDLQRFSKQTYHEALAEFSTWGINALARLSINPENAIKHFDLRKVWINSLQNIQKSWTESAPDNNPRPGFDQERIQTIEKEIMSAAENFRQEYQKTGIVLEVFKRQLPPEHSLNPVPKNDMIAAKQEHKMRSQLLGKIWMQLYTIDLTAQKPESFDSIASILSQKGSNTRIIFSII